MSAYMAWMTPGDLVFTYDVLLKKTKNGSKMNPSEFVCHCLPSQFLLLVQRTSQFFVAELLYSFLALS
jgi:hypothetical protein